MTIVLKFLRVQLKNESINRSPEAVLLRSETDMLRATKMA